MTVMTDKPKADDRRRHLGRALTNPPSEAEQLMLDEMRNRIKDAIERKGMNYTDIGMWLGVSKQSVAAWIRGDAYPNPINMLRLCEVLDIEPGELWTGLKSDLRLETPINKRLANRARLVPLYTGEDTAGLIQMGQLQPSKEIDAIAAPIDMDQSSFSFRVTTDANVPEIKPGDVVFIDPKVRPTPGRWVFAALGNEFLLRKYHPATMTTSAGATLKAANPAWPDETMDGDAQIIGVLVFKGEVMT